MEIANETLDVRTGTGAVLGTGGLEERIGMVTQPVGWLGDEEENIKTYSFYF